MIYSDYERTWIATFSSVQRNKSIAQVMACRATAGVPSFKRDIKTGIISGNKSKCFDPISPIILYWKKRISYEQ